MKRIVFILIVVAAAGAGFLLVTGHWVLNQEIGFLAGVPAGNLIAWAGLAAWAALALRATPGNSRLRWPARLLVALALVWFPVSVALVGNLHLSGGGGWKVTIWLYYTAALLAVPLAFMLVGLMLRLVVRLQLRRTA